MQTYALRLKNFMRFGETNNSIVFDLSEEDEKRIRNGEATLDQIYDEFAKDPVSKVKKAKERGLASLIGIVGKIDGNLDTSNGAGKSTLLEGICYAHYEKIVRQTANSDKTGVAGTSVVTKINKKYPKSLRESYVEEFFEERGKLYRVKRGRSFSKSHNSSSPLIEFECLSDNQSKEGHRSPDTKESIDEINVNDYDIFVNSQMMGQNDAGKFLTGTDKVIKEMIVNLLKMDHAVEKCLKLTRDKKNANLKEIDKIEYKVVSAKDDLKNIHTESFEDDFDQSDLSKTSLLFDAKINKNTKDINLKDKTIEGLQKEINDLQDSEKIKEKERIKSEGQKIKKQLQSLTEEKESESKTWEDLKKSVEQTIKSNTDEKQRLEKVLENKNNQISKTSDEIKEKKFSEEKEELLSKLLIKISKSKEVEEKLNASLDKTSDEKEKMIKEVGEKEGVLTFLQDKGKNLKKCLEKIKDGEKFECPECDSLVPKDHFETKLNEYRTDFKEKQAIINSINDKINELKKEEEDIKSKKSKIESLVDSKNDLEKEKNQFDNLEKSLVALNESKEETEQSLKSIEIRINDSQKQIANAQHQIDAVEEKYEKKEANISKELKSLAAKYKLLDQETKEIEEKITQIQDDKSKIQNERNNINKQNGSLSEKKKNYESLVKKLGDSTKEFADLQVKKDRYAKLEKYFGLEGVQTRIVQKYLPLLNVYVKEFLDILSEGKMEVNFSINDKSKVDCIISGGTAESFTMLSGGEKMIVRLAVDIGLSLLSFSRSSQKPEMVCLDEIFGPLDKSKSKAVFKMLEVLRDKFKRVILISHDPDIQSMVEKNIVVEKDSGMYGLSIIKTIE